MSDQIRNRGKKGNGGQRSSFPAACAVCAGLLAIIKRILLTNRIGDNGNAYFGMAFDTWLFFTLLCGPAMQTAVAEMTAARSGRGGHRNAGEVWRAGFGLALLLGAAGSVLMYVSADWAAGRLFHTGLSSVALKLLAPAVVLSAFLGLMRGYFQGMGTMVPTALSRLVEEAVSLAALLLLVPALSGYGKKVGDLLLNAGYEQAFGAAGGVLGSLTGALFALLLLTVIYLMLQGSFRRRERRERDGWEEGRGRLAGELVRTAAPLAFAALAFHGSYMIDQLLFLGLTPAGSDTVVQWGIYTGKYRILSGIPVMAASFLCTFLMPSVAVSAASRNMGRLKERTLLMLRCALAVSLPLAVYGAVMSDTLMKTLFTAGDTAVAAGLLRVGSIAVVLQSVGTAFACALQGMKKERILLINSVIALVVHIILAFILVKTAGLGIQGILYAVIGMSLVYAALNGTALMRLMSLRADWGRFLGAPVIGTGVAGLVLFMINRLLSGRVPGALVCILGLVLGAVIYFALLITLHGVTERDLRQVPGGGLLILAGRAMRFF